MKYLILIIFLFFTTKFCVGQTRSTIHQNVRKYRLWIVDTLKAESHNCKKNTDDLLNSRVILSPDSTSLEFRRYYQYKNISKGSISKETKRALLLLNEYHEKPRGSFVLSFVVSLYTMPSDVDQMKYNFVYDIDSLTVKTQRAKISYDYNRGALSGKTTFFYKSKNTVNYAFDFKDKKR